MNPMEALVKRLERTDRLDQPAGRVADTIGRVSRQPFLASVLSGTPLGHPLHPILTDLPIGSWTSAFVLDLFGGRASRRAAQALVGFGVLSAVPTAVTGMSDWADTEGAPRRVGVVHGLANTAALALYALSWRSRRRGHHGSGVVLGLAGATAATVGAHLGGHLVYRTGTGVDVNAGRVRHADWVPVTSVTPVSSTDGRDIELLIGEGEEVLATRSPAGRSGIAARCSHRGGPLQEGRIADGCVRCPWHGSEFGLVEGDVLSGPATAPQARYEVREETGSLSFRDHAA